MISGLKLYALIAAAVVLIGAFGGAYFAGRSAGAAACESRWLTREADRIERETSLADQRDARLAREQAGGAKRTAERLAQISNLTKKAEAYEEELARRPDPGCVLSDADASSLSDIK